LYPYFQRFIASGLAFEHWREMAGSWLENRDSWLALKDAYPHVQILRYEEMFQPAFVAKSFGAFLGRDPADILVALDIAESSTEDGGKFFWSKKKNNYVKYLSSNAIAEFEARYGDLYDWQ
jgi:hypothetical protein